MVDYVVKEYEPDPLHVEQLVKAAMSAMENASIPDVTSPADVLSACFTILDRMLNAMSKLQSPEDRAVNVKEIARILDDFKVSHGKLPN